MPPDGNLGATVVVIEMEPGHVYVKIEEPRPEPRRANRLIRKTIDSWFGDRPQLVVDRMETVNEAGEAVGAHVWYHAVNPPAPPASRGDAAEQGGSWTVELSDHLLDQWPKERIEAVFDEAVDAWNQIEDRPGRLLLVNTRRIAVVLNGRSRGALVIPVESAFSLLDEGTRRRLMDWLEAPLARLFLVSIPDA